ncbi:MAG: hypothetical protein EU541_06520 [Promethearchaeota archaeon]|nr:MAG: hypothetical protein EU541_06520 [Candidatus Lokiarchaeota archaeon]
MSSEKDLADLFKKWNNLNQDVAGSFQELDFSSIKDSRKIQREIEDYIYKILLQSAPSSILELLPEDCGTMELGLNTKTQKFYFLMEDPEDPGLILAITIDEEKNVEIIKDFQK